MLLSYMCNLNVYLIIMVSAWSMGKGRRGLLIINPIGCGYLNLAVSPGPAAYSPSTKSRYPIPSWRYIEHSL